MAGLALPVVHTVTVEVVEEVDALASVQTRVSAALVHIDVTQTALPAVGTEAVEGVYPIDARRSVFTRQWRTVVYVLVAVRPGEPRVTGAAEVPGRQTDAAPMGSTDVRRDVPHTFLRVVGCHSDRAAVNHFALVGFAVVLELGAGFAFVGVLTAAVEVASQAVTLGFVVARVWAAGITLQLAGRAREPLWAFTLKPVQECVTAPAVLTRTAPTAVPLDLTVLSRKSGLARALVAPGHLLTRPSVLTPASVHIYLAGLSCPLQRTDAFKVVLQINTGPAVSTGVRLALICVFSAGGAGPSWGTVTLKA